MRVIGEKAQMYAAYSTRLRKLEKEIPENLRHLRTSERIKQFLRKKGFAPLIPFDCGELQDFEFGPIGRKDTLKWTFYLQRYHFWSGYFGWSEGVMKECWDRISWDNERRMRFFYEDENGIPFDPLWEEEYQKWSKVYGDPLAELRGEHRRLLFVGVRGSGKTWAIKQLLKAYPETLEVIQGTTTRPLREEDDKLSYKLVNQEQFQEQQDSLDFVEHANYHEYSYGSSFSEARRVLKSRHGIGAMTPEGVIAWHKECRFDFNLLVVLLTAPPAVLKKSFERRGILDPKKHKEYFEEANKFVLPFFIPHMKLGMTGTKADKERILDLVGPLLK
jgi:guanylate kinase